MFQFAITGEQNLRRFLQPAFTSLIDGFGG
nr:MAG TPA: GIY-YIG nuclease superfamily protein [Caudoviricetes sp.]